MTRPADIQPPLLWYGGNREDGSFFAEGFQNPDGHDEPCRVYWGSHGCARPRGHDGPHWCDCCECESHPDFDSGCVGGPPYYGTDTNFFGEDSVES